MINGIKLTLIEKNMLLEQVQNYAQVQSIGRSCFLIYLSVMCERFCFCVCVCVCCKYLVVFCFLNKAEVQASITSANAYNNCEA